MAVGQEAKAGAAIAGPVLVTGETALADVLPQGGTESFLVQDILHIDLDEAEGGLFLPSPKGRVERFAPSATSSDDAMAAQDMADGMRRDNESLPLQVEGQAFSSVVGSLTDLQHPLFHFRAGLVGRVMGTPGAVSQALLSLFVETADPLAHHQAEVCQRRAVSLMLAVSW